MKPFRRQSISTCFTAVGLIAALAVSTGAARADVWDKKTRVSFSQSIEVPGAVLEPGKYVMKLVDLPADRHVVQFLNDRENHVYATAMAIPTYREKVTDYTAIAFYEAPAGQPQAIRTWYYPGDNYGQEFLYPKGSGGPRLAGITTSSSQTTLSERSETKAAPVEPVNPPAPQAEATPAPAPAPEPSEPIEIAQAPTPAPRQETPVAPTAPAPAPTDKELPKTSSNIGEIALVGLGALTAAAGVRKLRRSES